MSDGNLMMNCDVRRYEGRVVGQSKLRYDLRRVRGRRELCQGFGLARWGHGTDMRGGATGICILVARGGNYQAP